MFIQLHRSASSLLLYGSGCLSVCLSVCLFVCYSVCVLLLCSHLLFVSILLSSVSWFFFFSPFCNKRQRQKLRGCNFRIDFCYYNVFYTFIRNFFVFPFFCSFCSDSNSREFLSYTLETVSRVERYSCLPGGWQTGWLMCVKRLYLSSLYNNRLLFCYCTYLQ